MTIRKPDFVRQLDGLLSPNLGAEQCPIIARQRGGDESTTTNHQFRIKLL
jgi:hypothetical protein